MEMDVWCRVSNCAWSKKCVRCVGKVGGFLQDQIRPFGKDRCNHHDHGLIGATRIAHHLEEEVAPEEVCSGGSGLREWRGE